VLIHVHQFSDVIVVFAVKFSNASSYHMELSNYYSESVKI